MKYTLSETERKRRRAYTATLPKCRCGNVVKKDTDSCTRCAELREERLLQERRDAWIDSNSLLK